VQQLLSAIARRELPVQYMDLAAPRYPFLAFNLGMEPPRYPVRVAFVRSSAGLRTRFVARFHDDLAYISRRDSVLHESTRFTCVFAVFQAQSTYYPRG